MHTLKLTAIGTSTGVILPKELLAQLNVEKGDSLFITKGPDGDYRLSPYDPEVERQLELGRKIMRDDRDILRALAK